MRVRARPRTRYLPADTGQRMVSAIAPNVLDRQFHAPVPSAKWIADFTYIWTAEGWLYVAVVIDLFSRRVVGWSMSASMTALASNPPFPPLGAHSFFEHGLWATIFKEADMSGRAMDFIEAWMEANVKRGDDAERLAGEALAAALAEGITKAEIEDETGPLAAWIEEAVINLAMPLRTLSRLLTTEPRASALIRLGAARDNSQRIIRQWPLQL